jgi:hypothetical protein
MRFLLWLFLLTTVFCPTSSVTTGSVEMAGGPRKLPPFAIARFGTSRFGHGSYIDKVRWTFDGK